MGSAEHRQNINMSDRGGRRIIRPITEITVETQVGELFGGRAGPAAQPFGGQRGLAGAEPPRTRTGDPRGARLLEGGRGGGGGVRAEQPPAADGATLVVVE